MVMVQHIHFKDLERIVFFFFLKGPSHLFLRSSIIGRAVAGGEEQSQLVGGDVTAVDLDQLDSGAHYEVQVMAIVQNREGSPVSVRITTRESHLCYSFQLISQVHNKLSKLRWMYSTVIYICFLEGSFEFA